MCLLSTSRVSTCTPLSPLRLPPPLCVYRPQDDAGQQIQDALGAFGHAGELHQLTPMQRRVQAAILVQRHYRENMKRQLVMSRMTPLPHRVGDRSSRSHAHHVHRNSSSRESSEGGWREEKRAAARSTPEAGRLKRAFIRNRACSNSAPLSPQPVDQTSHLPSPRFSRGPVRPSLRTAAARTPSPSRHPTSTSGRTTPPKPGYAMPVAMPRSSINVGQVVSNNL